MTEKACVDYRLPFTCWKTCVLSIVFSASSGAMPHSTSSPVPFNKRGLSTLFVAVGIIFLLYVTFRETADPQPSPKSSLSHPPINDAVAPEILKGGVISSKIENATVKAELGRAGWKLFHTTMAKFPDKPSKEEQTALASYIHLFARLYPCGECAGHFQKILEKFPPQVSTRSTAAAWACHVHNEVNKSLEKDMFDCSNIGDFYDCGCADDDEAGKGKKEKKVKKGGGRIELSIEKNG